MKKPKLLAPAGDMSRLKTAIDYGADAVYIGGKMFGLRANAGNFDLEEIAQGVGYAHEQGKEVYVTVNILAHNYDLATMEEYIRRLIALKIDGIIAADAGVIAMIRQIDPAMHISLSTQASCTNYRAAQFWHQAGVNRIVLARELSAEEIAEIIQKKPDGLQIEIFVHGAMCIAYSDRCLLSHVMAARSANRGDCAQPCRWNYRLVEEKRQGEYFPVFEEEQGTYILNSKDLCLIEHLDKIIDMGVDVLKIEGRMKTEFYVATVVGAYRRAIDAYMKSPAQYHGMKDALKEEVKKISYREYTTGFFCEKTDAMSQNYNDSSYVRDWEFAGVVMDYDPVKKAATIQQRNKVVAGTTVEIIGPYRDYITYKIEQMRDIEGNSISSAPRAMQLFCFDIDAPLRRGDMIRQPIK